MRQPQIQEEKEVREGQKEVRKGQKKTYVYSTYLV